MSSKPILICLFLAFTSLISITPNLSAQTPGNEVFGLLYTYPDGSTKHGGAATHPSGMNHRALELVEWFMDDGPTDDEGILPEELGVALFCDNDYKTENDNLLLCASGTGQYWIAYYRWQTNASPSPTDNKGSGGYAGERMASNNTSSTEIEKVTAVYETKTNGSAGLRIEATAFADAPYSVNIDLKPLSDFGIFEAKVQFANDAAYKGIGYRVPLTQSYVVVYGEQPESLSLHALYQLHGQGWGGHRVRWGEKQATEEEWHIH